MYDSDESIRTQYYQNINRVNRRDRRRYDCPDCGAKGALTAYEKMKGYHCSACTRSLEGPSYYDNGGDCY